MARKVADIQKQIQDAAVHYFAEAGITLDVATWSRRNIIRLWTFIMAATIAVFEQILDIFKSNVEDHLARGAAASAPWLQNKALEFQYSDIDPQLLKINDGIPGYNPVREDLRIITRASVQTTLSNNVKIKVAKNEPPIALSGGELSAFAAYIRDQGAAGINYTCTSTEADKLAISADIYYLGQFSGIIIDNLEAAIKEFLKSIPFNGSVRISSLETAIRATPGVTDVVLKSVRARKDSIPIASATYLVRDNSVLEREWSTDAGYIIPETTGGYTLADLLNYIAA